MKPAASLLTIRDISRRARVSTATVSRALDARTAALVAPATRARVQRVVRQTGYAPHLAARHMRHRSWRTLGVVMAHVPGVFFSDYHAKVLAGVADALLTTDYRFKLVLLRPGGSFWDRHDFQAAEGVDGLIVTHWGAFFSGRQAAEKLRLPCVTIGDPEAEMRVHCYGGDNRRGGALAAEHLLRHGHRRIAILSGAAYSSDSRQRIEGFKQAALRSGLRDVRLTLLPSDGARPRLRQHAEALLQQHPRPTAVFACTDDMALGLLEALTALGAACPQDFSVMGYDDDARGALSQPPLTTIRAPVYEAARQGALRLVRYLEGERQEFFCAQTVLPVELVERQSVANIREGTR